jgi:hypothetical protein
MNCPVPGGYKYGDLAVQSFGSEFCGTSTQECILWQGPEAIVKPAIVRQKKKIGHGILMGARYQNDQDRLAN